MHMYEQSLAPSKPSTHCFLQQPQPLQVRCVLWEEAVILRWPAPCEKAAQACTAARCSPVTLLIELDFSWSHLSPGLHIGSVKQLTLAPACPMQTVSPCAVIAAGAAEGLECYTDSLILRSKGSAHSDDGAAQHMDMGVAAVAAVQLRLLMMFAGSGNTAASAGTWHS